MPQKKEYNHIAIPQLTLRRFAEKKEKYLTCVYDLNKNTIRNNVDISKPGTSLDYYKTEVEKDILSQEIERPFGDYISKLLKQTEKQNYKAILCNLKFIKTVAKFVNTSIYRSPKVAENIKKNVENGPLKFDGSSNFNPSEVIKYQKCMRDDKGKEIADNPENIQLLINDTKNEFINNSLGFAICKQCNDSSEHFIIPISPRFLLKLNDILIQKDKYIEHINNESCITFINLSILQTELGMGLGFILSKTEENMRAFLKWK